MFKSAVNSAELNFAVDFAERSAFILRSILRSGRISVSWNSVKILTRTACPG